MPVLGNSPHHPTKIRLEAGKSYALNLVCLTEEPRDPLDLTGCTIRMVVRQPQNQGGAVILTKNATVVDAPHGLVAFYLQASELALDERAYPYSITLVAPLGYSTTIVRGELDVRANPDSNTSNTYTSVNPADALEVIYAGGDQVTVHVKSVDGFTDILYGMISDDINAAVAALRDGVSSGRDTLKELSDAIDNVNTMVTNLTGAVNTKASAADLTAHTSNTSNPHAVTKVQVGLGNVDNTSDTAKPVSTAQQAALDLKADTSTLSAHTANTSNPHSVTKAQVGLGNVDNTADTAKPVSTAQQAALDSKADLVSGKVPEAQLPDLGSGLGSDWTAGPDWPSNISGELDDATPVDVPTVDGLMDQVNGSVTVPAPLDFGVGEATDIATIAAIAYEGVYNQAVDLAAHGADTSNPHSVTKAQVGLGNVDNTADTAKPVSTAQQAALNLKADTSALSAHTTNTSNPHSVTKAQVGLGNVDNTADTAKPVSTAQQAALNLKADTSALSAHTTNTSNPHSVTKAQVGLGNVDNTSDTAKPVSTAQQAALNLKANISSLAAVATSGAYSDLTGAPDTSQMLTSGQLGKTLNTPWNPIPSAWDGNTDAPAGMSGLSQTSGVFKASVDGTMGRAVIPILNTFMGDCRVSFRVKVNKSLANGRRMTVGFAEGTPSTPTSGSDKTFEVGFMNKNSGGSSMGIIQTQDNVWGGEAFSGTGVQYSDLVDSGTYDISLHYARLGSSISGSSQAQIGIRVVKVSDGTVVYQQARLDRTQVPVNVVISSNTNVGELSNVKVAMHPFGELGIPSYNRIKYTTQSSANEVAGLIIPAKPNGRVAFCFHGMGETDRYWAAASGESPTAGFVSMTEALVAAGYIVAIPLMRGSFSSQNTFGNLTAQQCVKDLYSLLVGSFGAHPRVYLVGNSAGGFMSWILAETRPFPIAAMYQAEAASNFPLSWVDGTYGATIRSAWGNDTTLRDQYDPNARPASDFAGIPIYMIASTGDTTVPKAQNTDLMKTKLDGLSGVKSHWSLAASGGHGDSSHFRPLDMLTLFRSNP